MKYTAEEAKAVANTIFQQIGGRRMSAMTGAKNFAFDKDGSLSFAFPRSAGVNRCRIELMPTDTYKMTFSLVHGKNYTVKHVVEDVYCDQLEAIFESKTGLFTSL